MAGDDGQDERPPGTPRWVKIIGWVLAALVVLVIVAQLSGFAGEHGPGRHLPR